MKAADITDGLDVYWVQAERDWSNATEDIGQSRWTATAGRWTQAKSGRWTADPKGAYIRLIRDDQVRYVQPQRIRGPYATIAPSRLATQEAAAIKAVQERKAREHRRHVVAAIRKSVAHCGLDVIVTDEGRVEMDLGIFEIMLAKYCR